MQINTPIPPHKDAKDGLWGCGWGLSIQLIWLAACQVVPTNANLISKQESYGRWGLQRIS